MQKFELLDFGKIYHIYNKGINGQEIFSHQEHFIRFLYLYEKYIDLIAETYAWCLMGNHFHFLLKIKDPNQIKASTDFIRHGNKEINQEFLSRQFSNLFNAYAQSYNKRMKRTGSLFQTPFQRKPVDNEDYFMSLVIYIHNNPVKHCFCERVQDYPWSSYSTLISINPTKLHRDRVIGRFDGKANFIALNNGKQDQMNISRIIFEEP